MCSLFDVGYYGFDIEFFETTSHRSEGIFSFELFRRKGETEYDRVPFNPKEKGVK